MSLASSFKNSGILGGAKLISVVFASLKIKAIAIFLGSTGVGYIGLFENFITNIVGLFGAGIPFSSVREFSIANSKDDEEDINHTLLVGSRLILILSLFVTLLCFVFARSLANYVFGDESWAWSVRIGSVSVGFTNLSLLLISKFQAKREMKKVASYHIISQFVVAILSIVIYYFLGVRYVALVILVNAILLFAYAFFISKDVTFSQVFSLKSITGMKEKSSELLRTGLTSSMSAFMTSGSLLFMQWYVKREFGDEDLGGFIMSMTLSVTYMNLIFSSLSTDYFPKLSALINDEKKTIECINDQIIVVLLFSVPLLVGMLLFSEYVIQLLYSSEFLEFNSLLMIFLLSILIRAISFPFGYTFLAMGKKTVYFFNQVIWNALFVGLSLLAVSYYHSSISVGVVYVISYILAYLVNWFWISRFLKFRLTQRSLFLGILSILIVSGLFALKFYTDWLSHLWLGVLVFSSVGGIYIHLILRYVDGIKTKILSLLSKK